MATATWSAAAHRSRNTPRRCTCRRQSEPGCNRRAPVTEPPPWTVLAERSVVDDGAFIDLRAETVRTATGAVLDPYWVMHLADWVITVALTPDDWLVLVRLWRQGVKAWVLEPPGGVMDADETDPCVTAA